MNCPHIPEKLKGEWKCMDCMLKKYEDASPTFKKAYDKELARLQAKQKKRLQK